MLRVESFVKKYEGFCLEIPFLEVRPGEIVGLLGHNGAGKSTLLKGIVGVISTEPGSTVRIGGESIAPLDRNRYVSLIAERHPMYAWMTVDEHFKFLSRFYRSWDWALNRRLCERLRVPGAKRILELSKGTQLKTAIISALSQHPKVLLLDEPTSGLDLESRTEILDQLYEAKSGGSAVIFSSHIVEDIQSVATSVAILANGQLRLVSPVDNIYSDWIAYVVKIKPANSAEKFIRCEDGSWVGVHPLRGSPVPAPDYAHMVTRRPASLREVFLTVGAQ